MNESKWRTETKQVQILELLTWIQNRVIEIQDKVNSVLLGKKINELGDIYFNNILKTLNKVMGIVNRGFIEEELANFNSI